MADPRDVLKRDVSNLPSMALTGALLILGVLLILAGFFVRNDIAKAAIIVWVVLP